MADIIQVRRGTAANAVIVNPVLAEGEPGYESDTGKLKIGDGVTAWNDLPYYTTNEAGAVTFEALNTNGDVGSGADQVAAGDHDHEIGDVSLVFENALV